MLRNWFVKKSNFVFEDKLFLLIQNTQNYIEKFSLLHELLPLTNLNDNIIYVTLFWQICAPHTLLLLNIINAFPAGNIITSSQQILSCPNLIILHLSIFRKKIRRSVFRFILGLNSKVEKKNCSYMLAASKVKHNVKNEAGSLHVSWNIFGIRIYFIFYFFLFSTVRAFKTFKTNLLNR